RGRPPGTVRVRGSRPNGARPRRLSVPRPGRDVSYPRNPFPIRHVWARFGGMAANRVNDAHRHIGVMPAFPFYGGPPVQPDISARSTVKQFIEDLDREGTERAVVMPNYGVPDASVSFSLNPLVLEAAATDDRIRAGLWVSPRPVDAEMTDE